MKKLSDLLERFTKLAQSSDDAKQYVIDAINNTGIKISLDIKHVTIRGTIATLKLSPVQKSEVSLKQKKIIEELKKNPLTAHLTVVR